MSFSFISPELWSIRGKNKCFYLPSRGCHNSLFNHTPQFTQTCFVDRRDAHTFVTQHTRFYFQTFLITRTKKTVRKVLAEQKNKLYTRYHSVVWEFEVLYMCFWWEQNSLWLCRTECVTTHKNVCIPVYRGNQKGVWKKFYIEADTTQ